MIVEEECMRTEENGSHTAHEVSLMYCSASGKAKAKKPVVCLH
jgi:hypothetical protein